MLDIHFYTVKFLFHKSKGELSSHVNLVSAPSKKSGLSQFHRQTAAAAITHYSTFRYSAKKSLKTASYMFNNFVINMHTCVQVLLAS